MTPPNLTGSALAAWHRSEAARIENALRRFFNLPGDA